jgi:hypothetical protein
VRRLLIMFVYGKFGTVITVQPVFRSNPNITLTILKNLVDETVGQFHIYRKHFSGLGISDAISPVEKKKKRIFYFQSKMSVNVYQNE